MEKFVIDIHIERSEKQDYPLLDSNEIMLELAQQFVALTKRFDTRIHFPLTLKLQDEKLGYLGKVSAGMVDADDEQAQAMHKLADADIRALMQVYQAELLDRDKAKSGFAEPTPPPEVDDAVSDFVQENTGWRLDGQYHRALVTAVKNFSQSQRDSRKDKPAPFTPEQAAQKFADSLKANLSDLTLEALVRLFSLYGRRP